MELLLGILIILVAARAFGEIAERAGQPSIVGQILAGVIIGPFAFNFLSPTAEIQSLAFIGVFFLMFVAGMEINPKDFVKTSKYAIAAASGGVALPILLGVGVGLTLGPMFIPGFSTAESLILGLCLSITAVGVSVDTLLELGKLKTDVGETIIEAGVIDDITGLVGLAVITTVLGMHADMVAVSVPAVLANIVLFFSLFTFIGVYLFPKLLGAASRFRGPEPLFASAVIITLFYAFFSENLVGSGIVGAFMAGVFTRHAVENHPKVERGLLGKFTSLSNGMLSPIFFVWVGLLMSPVIFTEMGVFVFALIVIGIAVIGKIGGAGLGSHAAGLPWKKSLQVGAGMNGRGAVELVIAGIALNEALISHSVFSVIVLMALVTTLMTPVLLEILVGRK
jgi:Kef-type K+ transport system membrane component KefB